MNEYSDTYDARVAFCLKLERKLGYGIVQIDAMIDAGIIKVIDTSKTGEIPDDIEWSL